MPVTFQFEAQLRQAAGCRERSVALPEASTLADALRVVAGELGEEFQQRVLDDSNEPRMSILLFVNDEPVQHADAATRSLAEGDRILLFPPISGG